MMKIILRTFGVLAALFVVLVVARVVYRFPYEMAKRDAADIRALRVTIDDVTGTKAPPMPSDDVRDATVDGVDINHNLIRDDVEQAMFTQYPVTNLRADHTVDTTRPDTNLKEIGRAHV